MPEPEVELPENAAQAVPASGSRRWPYLLTIVLALFGLAVVALWVQRENLAHRIIGKQIEQYDLPATYKLEQVGPLTQVITGVVVGDPARPDFTAERVEIRIAPTLGLPTIGSVRLVKARLYGSYQDGKLSFGALDKVFFAPSTRAPGLPDLNLRLEDGRARIETDLGLVGIKADGRGNLRNSFAGQLAAIAPELRFGDCRMNDASAYGAVTSQGGAPQFSGPLRLRGARCPDLSVGPLAIQAEIKAAADLASLAAKGKLAGGPLAAMGQRVRQVDGDLAVTANATALTGRYQLGAEGLDGLLAARTLGIEGIAQSLDGHTRLAAEGQLSGAAVRPGPALDQTLARAERSAAGTLGAPLLAQLRRGLRREGSESQLSADFTLRRNGNLTSLIVPQLELTGSSGQDLLVLSRGQLAFGGPGGVRLTGNLRTGGQGLPRLSGQVERRPGGVIEARLTMPEYRAGDARVALSRLVIVRRADGATGLSGQAMISGALPGGRVERLTVPIDGTWSDRRGLAMWRRCTPLRFDSLRYANLTLDAKALTLCPGPGGAILTSNARGTRFAAGAPALALSGRLGDTPIVLRSAAVGFAWPGSLAARNVDVALGQPDAPNRFTIASLTGQLGTNLSGQFSGAEARLDAVPLDLVEASGTWNYTGGILSLGEGAFRLLDRVADDRFRPLIARDASLTLADNRIAAQAVLREPSSDRIVTEAKIAHDLDSARGHADLLVADLLFDDRLQPDTLTYLALGVIANAEGRVSGTGRIDWTGDAVTSTGRFTTDKFNFAAAFGPVDGVSGTVEFTDLLGLVTAPDQRLKIASINPGIEVYDGELSFQLEPDGLLVVNGAEWPFIDGELHLLPTRMKLGAAEQRRFTLKVVGADAAQFVQQLEMSNMAARGVFDGELPLVFDEDGGRIEGGLLVARAPGGNLSYIGALTYKDMGAMANFAFQSLRSLDFKGMTIGLDGELDGEIFTRLRIDGVTQGEGAKRNFVTRQVARLPIRFNINIRAPFQRLLHSFRSLYDPTYVRDPRDLGLVDSNGRPIAAPTIPAPLPPDIQPPDSRKVP